VCVCVCVHCTNKSEGKLAQTNNKCSNVPLEDVRPSAVWTFAFGPIFLVAAVRFVATGSKAARIVALVDLGIGIAQLHGDVTG